MKHDTEPGRVKSDIVDKYDAEAVELDTDAWLRSGDGARVPESRSAHYFIGRKVEMALAMSGVRPEWTVHEIGCSFGHMTSLLAPHFRRVVATDISPASVALAAKRLRTHHVSNVICHVADAEDLALFEQGSFDATYCFSSIRFFPRPDRALAEMKRTLVPGGVLVIDFPNRRSPWHLLLKPLLGIRKHVHDRLYTTREAVALLQAAGFEDVRAVEFLFTSRRLPDAFLPLFRLLDRVFEGTALRTFAGIIMVSAKKP